ncbi:MAG: hypothetical protein R3C61_22960 [Bacteroidia bacterium]
MKQRNLISFSALIILSYVVIRVAFLYPKWEKSHTEATVSWDVFGYYLYLPAAIIYDDLGGLAFKDEIGGHLPFSVFCGSLRAWRETLRLAERCFPQSPLRSRKGHKGGHLPLAYFAVLCMLGVKPCGWLKGVSCNTVYPFAFVSDLRKSLHSHIAANETA